VAFSQYVAPPASLPAPRRRTRRLRRCLLKGCDRFFRPTHPQARYCSDHCRQQARRWRRWYHSHGYRTSDQGKCRRREQSRRYRARRRQRCAGNLPGLAPPEPPPVPPSAAQTTPASAVAVFLAPLQLGREGQRPAIPDKILPPLPCRRPGCYELFPFCPSRPQRRYCCPCCRQASPDPKNGGRSGWVRVRPVPPFPFSAEVDRSSPCHPGNTTK
jgi:hypothetical protein